MDQQPTEETAERERFQILSRLEGWLEWPLVGLAFIWLGLLIVEFVYGQARWLETLGVLIWIVFIADFLVRLLVAPLKISFLKSNWLILLSLIVPALRVFRVFSLLRVARVARAARSAPHPSGRIGEPRYGCLGEDNAATRIRLCAAFDGYRDGSGCKFIPICLTASFLISSNRCASALSPVPKLSRLFV